MPEKRALFLDAFVAVVFFALLSQELHDNRYALQ